MSGSTLKIIAVISMIVDHVGLALFPQYRIMRIIGRLAFPIFAFLLVEGYFHTKDMKKYLHRLFVLAFISEIPFDTALMGGFPEWTHQNIFFTLVIGLLTIHGIEYFNQNKNILMSLVSIFAGIGFAELISCDYGAIGIGVIICFYNMYKNPSMANRIFTIMIFAILNYAPIQKYAILALIPIYFYNGSRGIKLKYMFYAIYPVHLAIIAVIKYYGV